MITSSANTKIKQVTQWQAKAKERRRDRIFVTEGVKMYEEAPIESIVEVYLSQSMEEKVTEGLFSDKMKEKLQITDYEVVTDALFRKMSDTQTPQGILTVVRQPQYELEELLQQPNPLFLVLEGVQDPGNLGTIFRTGEGAGITGVIMDNQTVDLFNPKTIRATMGSIYRLPFAYTADIGEMIEKLHQRKVRIFAAHLKGNKCYSECSFREPTAFLIGNEGNGLSAEVADKADSYLKIPMEGQVESLNAAVAAAILMYEAHRQRSGIG
ncbi:MAG: RNA methyltransferase [Candidatus Gastranaerophilales bacterium]|nr:RNA methyltransferase [Candidatus Gastranaerophilales bacterium]